MTPPFTCHGSGSEYQPSTGCGSGAALVSGLQSKKSDFLSGGEGVLNALKTL